MVLRTVLKVLSCMICLEVSFFFGPPQGSTVVGNLQEKQLLFVNIPEKKKIPLRRNGPSYKTYLSILASLGSIKSNFSLIVIFVYKK